MYFGLIKNHAFHDGNKRVALLMLLHAIRRQKRWIKCKQQVMEKLTVAVAASTLADEFRGEYSRFAGKNDAEVLFLADFLMRNTRRVSETERSITFRELRAILNTYGFDLREPYGNKIGIFRIEKKRSLLGLGRPREVVNRVGSVGFPSWTKQVSRKDLNNVREWTGLTSANGVDSDVFYSGSEPMFGLIQDFEGPLRRLKDR